MEKDVAAYRVSQPTVFDSVFKPSFFDKTPNYSSYHDGKINKQICTQVQINPVEGEN